MTGKGKAAATGAATGAAAGSVLGPWGMAGGAVIGGALGYFGADDTPAPTYTPDKANFEYGLGPSSGYAAMEAARYAREREGFQNAAWDAQTREAPQQALPTRRDFVASQGQGYLAGADAAGRQEQLAALGGLQGANADLRRFAQGPEGPSAAQGMLQQATGSAIAQQNAMARTQRGGGGAAMRNAAFNAAGIQAQAGAQAAQLRAQEAQAFRNQQLQALGAVQQGAGMQANYAGQLRGGDQSFAVAQAGQANYDSGAYNSYNQTQQGMELQVGANNLNAALNQGQQNNAYTMGMLGYAQNYDQMRNDVAASQSQMGVAYEQARAAGAGIGSNNFNAAADRGQAETGMMLGAISGAAGAYGQMNQAPAASGYTTSDLRAKENIRPAEVAKALGGKTPAQAWDEYDQRRNVQQLEDVQNFRARQTLSSDVSEFGSPRALSGRELGMSRPSTETLRALSGGRPETDLRGAQPYQYEYKDPERHGEGSYVGPMAQDLEHLPGVVARQPDGTKAVNTPRLTMALTGAMSEQQRRLDRIEQLAALRGMG